MELNVYDLNNVSSYNIYDDALNKLNCTSPFYSLPFLQTFAENDNIGSLKTFILKDAQDHPIIMMPFYLRSLTGLSKNKKEYYDVISPYGYSGPIFNNDITSFVLKEFWDATDLWYKEQNVVSEFIRFSLNTNYTCYSGTLVESLHTVKGKLIDVDLIWKGYKPKVRKNINKAIRENLMTEVFYNNITEKIFEDFYGIYIQTMDRRKASEKFYYSKQKLNMFIDNCKKFVAIALVYKAEKPISSELLLLSDTTIFSFLGGTKEEYFNLRPNDLLKHTVIGWACKNKYKYFVLGGGHNNDDGIYDYKKSFFPNDIVTFYTGRKVLNNQMYSELSLINSVDINIADNFFPLYRAKLSIQKTTF